MAGPDFLSQLPSFEELLEHPRVKAAVDRLNHSTAASRVRTAVSSLGAEVARRAEELQGLTPGELLDRVVRRIDEPRRPIPVHKINATGEPFGPAWTQSPLPAVAIDAAQVAAQGYVQGAPRAAADAAKRVVGCEAAAFSSHTAALAIALQALAGGGVCLVARREMSELAPGVRLDEVCRRAGVGLAEVGAIDSATLDDYRAALPSDGQSVVVLRRSQLANEPSIAELAKLDGATLLVDAGKARPRHDTPAHGDASPSAEEALHDGAAAVVLQTAGRLGGPPAGLLVGRGDVVSRVADSSAARADGLAPMIDVALAATLDLFTRPEALRFLHPLYELLDAPIENLRSRAERLAPQLAAADRIANATAVERPGGSWAVRVEPAGESAADLRSRLAKLEPAIIADADGQAVLLDLRTVFAREDRALVAAFGAKHDETASAGDPGGEPQGD